MGWVYRPLDRPDYGIDGVVEIFDEQGNTTGKLFYVQLKATDEPAPTKALRLRLKMKTLNYYDSLKMPVLLVLWHAPGRQLFARWAHTRSRGLAWTEPKAIPREQQSSTVRLDPADLWDEDTPDALVAGLEAFAKFCLRDLEFPLKIWVRRQPSAPAPDTALNLRMFLDQNGTSGLIIVHSDSPSAGEAIIQLASDRTVINFGDTATVTLHHGEETPTPDDLLTCVAIALAIVRQPAMAAVLAAKIASGSSVTKDHQSVHMLGMCFFLSHRLSEARRLADAWCDQQGAQGTRAADVLLAPAMTALNGLPLEDMAALEDYVRRRLTDAEATGDTEELAKRHIQLAVLVGQEGQLESALLHYETAAAMDASCQDHHSWWRGYAGTLFELERFPEAATAYERSFLLGSEDVLALWADASFFSGNYQEALDRWHQHLDRRPPSRLDSEWRLRCRVAHFLVGRVGSAQVRHPDEAKRVAIVALNADKAKGEFFDLSWNAIQADACFAVPWFNLGVWFADSGYEESAFLSFLVAAVLARTDGEAWSNAAALSLRNPGTVELFPDIVFTARRLCGGEFVKFTMELVAAQGPSFGQSQYLEWVSGLETAADDTVWDVEMDTDG